MHQTSTVPEGQKPQPEPGKPSRAQRRASMKYQNNALRANWTKLQDQLHQAQAAATGLYSVLASIGEEVGTPLPAIGTADPNEAIAALRFNIRRLVTRDKNRIPEA